MHAPIYLDLVLRRKREGEKERERGREREREGETEGETGREIYSRVFSFVPAAIMAGRHGTASPQRQRRSGIIHVMSRVASACNAVKS